MSVIAPAKMLQDDFSGDWSKDMPDAFRLLNKFSSDASFAINGGMDIVKNLGWQKITLSSVSIPSDWTTVATFTNGWVAMTTNTTAPAYRKDRDGVVWMTGEIKSGTATTPAFTLPVGYRPDVWQFLPCYTGGAGPKDGLLLVKPDGTVSPYFIDNAEVALNVSFPCSDRSPGIPNVFPVKVKSAVGKVSSLVAGTIRDISGGTGGAIPSISDFAISWHNENGADTNARPTNNIVIDNIPSLLPNRTYSVTLYAIPER